MKIYHVTEYCHAGSSGGTERYILDLIRGLDKTKIQNEIVWIANHKLEKTFLKDNVKIIPVQCGYSRMDQIDNDFTKRIRSIITDEPDILHFHTFGRAEAEIAEVASNSRIPFVFTFHSPAWLCRRGDLLLWGKYPCNGRVNTVRCSLCKLHQRTGISPILGFVSVIFSVILNIVIGKISKGSFRRKLAYVSDTSMFKKKLRRFLTQSSSVISCANWSGPVLLTNSLNPDNLYDCPQGVPLDFIDKSQDEQASRDGLFIVGHTGRLREVKGIHILLEGFLNTTYGNARLRIYGLERTDNKRTDEYVQDLMERAKSDERIEFVDKLPMNKMVEEYRQLSLLAIPSLCFETGPLTLFEAISLGIPVYGSNRVGQIDMLRRYGIIIEPNTPIEWTKVLNEAFTQHESGIWRKEISKERIRTMLDVSSEMTLLYSNVIKNDD